MWEAEQEDQKFKVILSYIENWDLTQVIQNTVLKKEIHENKTKSFQSLVRLLTLNFTIARETHPQT